MAPTRRRSVLAESFRLTNRKDAKFIEKARKRFKQSTDADEKQRERELADLQFYAGDQWPQDVINARDGQPGNAQTGLPAVPARPTYVINKVKAPVRQVLNQERQADLGVEIAAADDFGTETPGVTPEEIELREGLVRRIQRESQAQDARSWAFSRAVIAGRGYYRVMTRYLPGKTNDQEVYVDRIYNQASVSLDPAHEQPDGSDAEWGFIGTDVPWDRYQADYGTVNDKPNALVGSSQSEWRALGDEAPGWFTTDGDMRFVRVVEYWYTERVTKTLYTLSDGSLVYDDELPDGAAIQDSRDITDVAVKWAKLDGVQVLERTDWPGKYIPIIKVVGEELQPFDSERRAEGMVRPSRDSQRGFNVMVSKWVEQIGLAPIPPWMGAAGFDEGFEAEYAASNTRTLAALHYNTKGLEGEPIPPPSRTSIQMEIQAIAGSVQIFDTSIKDTTMVPDPTLGNVDPTLKSGRAIRQVLEQSKQGTNHYIDNLARSIRYEGQIINDLLYPVYSRPGRLTRVMNPKGETQQVALHQPFVMHPQTKRPMTQMPGPNGQPMPVQPGMPGAQQLTLTPDATFNITVKVTKSFDSRRDEQENVLTSLVQADPQQMGIIGDLLFKYSDVPGHDELEKRYQAVLIPPVQAVVTGQPQIPPQLQQQMAQMQAQMAQLQQLADKNRTDLAKTQMQEQGDFQRAQLDRQTQLDKAQIAANAGIAEADIKAANADLDRRLRLIELFLTAQQERRLEAESQQHEHTQGMLEKAHEVGMAKLEHQHALEQTAAQPKPEPNNGSGNA